MSLVAPGIEVYESRYAAAHHALYPPLNLSGHAFQMWLVGGAVFGLVADTQPVNEPGDAINGVRGNAANSDFLYGRLYVQPSVVDLGNLISGQTRTVRVWNAQFFSADVESFSGVDTEGVLVAQPSLPPYTLDLLQEVDYVFSISLDGPASLDARYTLTVDGDDYLIQVVGSRVVLWPFKPQWSEPVEETLEWKTGVLTARSGSEQRSALRTRARRRLAYSFAILRQETQRFDNLLWGWQNRAFAVPFWQYRCRLASPSIVGATVLAVPRAAVSGFEAGQIAVVFADPDTYESAEVLSVAADSVTLTRPMSFAWPARTSIYPAGVCNLRSNVPVRRLTPNVLAGRVDFLADPVRVSPFIPEMAALDTFNGGEILLRRPDWQGGIDNNSEYPSTTTDFEIGAVSYGITVDTPSPTKACRWHFKSREAAKDFRALLGRRKGRLSPIYIPSWHDDFTLTAAVPGNAASFTCRDYQYFSLVGSDPAKVGVMFRTHSGASYLRMLTNVGKTGNDLLVGISTSLGVTLAIADVKAIHIVSLYRFASDEITVQWITDEVCVVDAAFKLVKQ